MHTKETSLTFTGHRNEKLPQTLEGMEKLKNKLWNEVDKAIEDGIDTFYFGGCRGFDLICAEIVSRRKRVIKMSDPKRIALICVVPFEEQAKNWRESDREVYYNILPLCDDVITLNTHYHKGCYHQRNRYMVDRSCRVICYYDGSLGGTAYTVNYATKHNLQITNLYEE